jgi:hypothetical protein
VTAPAQSQAPGPNTETAAAPKPSIRQHLCEAFSALTRRDPDAPQPQPKKKRRGDGESELPKPVSCPGQPAARGCYAVLAAGAAKRGEVAGTFADDFGLSLVNQWGSPDYGPDYDGIDAGGFEEFGPEPVIAAISLKL